jgi:cell division septum initiation protein DivIVA
MDDDDLRQKIVELEAQIEEFAQAIESCAKVIQVSRAAIAIGAILFLATMFGAIRFDPIVMIAGIAAMIGGVVFLGSNKSTSDAATAAMHAAEQRRAGLIGSINLRVVGH